MRVVRRLTRAMQTDLAHDSVHAAQRAAEKEAEKAAEAKRKSVSGRLLDAGVAKGTAKDKTDEPPRPTLNAHVHRHNPDGAQAGDNARRVSTTSF